MEEKSIISGRRKSGRHLNDTSGKSTDDATCKICLQIFRSPFVTLCGHTFCRECITNHLSHNSKCPECDSDLEHKRFRLIPNYTAAAIVQQKQRERNSLKRTAAMAGLGEMDEYGEALYDMLMKSDINICSIDRITEMLQKRRMELELMKTQKKNLLFNEFLDRMIAKREKSAKQIQTELDLLKADKQRVLALLRNNVPTSSQRIVPDSELSPSSMNIEDIGSPKAPPFVSSPTAVMPNEMLKHKTRLDKHLSSLETTYFNFRTHPFSDEDSDFSVGSYADGIEDFSQVLQGMSQYGEIKRLATLNYNLETSSALSIVSSIEFDKDGEYFVIAGVTKKIKVYDYNAVVSHANGTHYPITQLQCTSKISNVSLNPYTKNLLASSDYEGIVQLWDVNMEKFTRTFKEHEKRCWTVQFNNVDPHLMASGSDDAKVKLWSVTCPQSVATIDAKVNVCCVYFSPTNRNNLVFGSADHCVHLYDIRNTSKAVNIFRGHRKAVSYVKYCNETEVVSASTDSNLRVWDVNSGKCLRILKGHQNEKNFVGLATDGNHIVCGSENNQLYLYYKSISEPMMPYDFNSRSDAVPDAGDVVLSSPSDQSSMDFVSAVCWKKNTNVIVAANSQGTTHVLQLQ
jgi:E3 ubiquitin-protein ligase RFWD2